MGKRSAFVRNPRDFYPTPRKAVLPLLPHLPKGLTYAEPCAGDGALVQHLPLECVQAFDIAPMANGIAQGDALSASIAADLIITNPPWNRKILHPLIAHLSAQSPTWLLFDADWMHTKQSAPFLPWLRKVVSVGRLKWIADSPMTGKDNAAWYLFDQSAEGATIFIGRVET